MQIDRVMDSFAAHYCAQNPNIFEERDTCFILSFSIIMLNTALHNPNAKMKISAEQFIKQNKGINSGQDLPPDMLEAIYRNIKEEPFKIPDETYDDLMYTFFSPEREGWLMKQVKYRNQFINSALDTFMMDCPHDCQDKLCRILTISIFHLARQAGGLDAALLSPGVVCSVVKVPAAASLSPLCNLIAQRAADPEKPRQADPGLFYSECACL